VPRIQQCLAILGPLCLVDDARISIESNSLWALARIEMDGASIVSLIRSDSALSVDRRTMPRHCVGASCIHYHVYCSPEGERYSCRVTYAEPEDAWGNRVEITAADPARMASLLTRLRVRGYGSGVLYRLSDLTERSSDPNPPHCRPGRDPGCR
jgi:hypothetical protein